MSSVTIMAHESVWDPHAELWFAEPAGFTALPLDSLLAEPGAQAAEGMRKAMAPLLATAPSEAARQQFIALVASGQQMLAALCEFGTVHCSVGMHRDDIGRGSRPLLSLFSIAWRATATAPRAATAARAVTGAVGHSRIEYLELPSGPATLSETTSPPPPTPIPGLPQLPLLQVHAHLPHPDCKRMAVLTLSTTALARRGEYRAILRQVVDSVRFEDPMGTGA